MARPVTLHARRNDSIATRPRTITTRSRSSSNVSSRSRYGWQCANSSLAGRFPGGAQRTAAVRCAPPGNRPTRDEFANCQPYLERELAILGSQLHVVIVLGRVAMDSFLRAWRLTGHDVPSPKPNFGHGGRWRLPPITLVVSYHPSQRNTQTGRLSERMFHSIFRYARKALSPTVPVRKPR